uniref:Redoxin domain protein n=1 Tax=Solibacter usitatus (strain Ellin6076) TaxID=234267 RepID=Q028K1_SOLUE
MARSKPAESRLQAGLPAPQGEAPSFRRVRANRCTVIQGEPQMMRANKRSVIPILLLLALTAYGQQPSLINAVRTLIAGHDVPAAERLARSYQARTGPTPELAAAFSWIARAQFDAKNYDQADALAQETTKIASRFLMGQKLDDDPWLPTAQGAAIEVHAQVLAARGERAEALEYLRGQLKQFTGTSLAERIRKNINLLSLEGKPAPPLEEKEWLGPKPPSLAALRGHPVLLFFWAHWCSDCKAEIGIIANLRRTFAPQGLAVIGPTRLYGYVAGGEDAPAEKEKLYIEQVRKRFYADLLDMPAPLSAANFVAYGASSTPTLVLIDGGGIVRYYHPGNASEAELTARIRAALRK